MFAMNGYDLDAQHLNLDKKNSILHWSGMDYQRLFQRNWNSHTQDLIDQGYSDSTVIEYRYNSHGFRDRDFDSTPSGLALGCSFTEGTGIHEEHSWPRVLSKDININIWNLGVAGSCVDTCFRLLHYWISRLNVKFVVLSTPPLYRVELYHENFPYTLMNGGASVQTAMFSDWYKMWATDDCNAESNRVRNILAMQQICNQYNIPIVYIHVEDWPERLDHGRDLSHPGTKSNNAFAMQMRQKLIEENVI
jgi:hypothetical protein